MNDTLYAPPVGGDRETADPKPAKTEGLTPEDKANVNQSTPRYIAWIPCVSGELFFSETAHGLGICDRYLFNTAFYDEAGQFEKRLVVSTALVSWQDTQFTEQPLKGLYRVFFIAQSSSHHWLEATVFLVEKNRLDGVASDATSTLLNPAVYLPRANDVQELQALNAIENLVAKKLSAIISETSPSQLNGTEALIETITQHIKQIRSSVVHQCHLQIHKSGISEIRFVGTKKINGSDYAQSQGGARLLANQVFYYAKYLLHKHTHHSSENDSLTTAHLIKGSRQENADVLIRDLKRALVCGQRSTGAGADHTAKGIAQYGKALITSCHNLGLFSKQPTNGRIAESLKSIDQKVNRPIHQRYMDILGSSAQITQDRHKAAPKFSALANLVTNFKATALLLLAIIGPLLLFLNIMVFAEYSQRIKEDDSSVRAQASSLAPVGGQAYEFKLTLGGAIKTDENAAKDFDSVGVDTSAAPLIESLATIEQPSAIDRQFQKLENYFCQWPTSAKSCQSVVATFKQYAQADLFALLKILATLLLVSLTIAAGMLEWGKVNVLGTVNKKLFLLGVHGSTFKPVKRFVLLPITLLSLYIAQARIAFLAPKRISGLLVMTVTAVLCLLLGGYLFASGFMAFLNADW